MSTGEPVDAGWDAVRALGHAVRQRRQELGLTQEGLSDAGGPSDVTIRKIERGDLRRLKSQTLSDLDHALQWSGGEAEHILRGDPSFVTGTGSIQVTIRTTLGETWVRNYPSGNRRRVGELKDLTEAMQQSSSRVIQLTDITVDGEHSDRAFIHLSQVVSVREVEL